MTATPTHQSPKSAPIPLWSGTRPSPPARLTASVTFLTRGLIKLRRVPEQAADAVLIPVIFTVLFTYLFGGAIAGSTGRYLHFLLPGTLVMTVLLVTVYAGIGLNMDKARGVSDRFRSLALWRPAHVAGALLTEAVRALVASAIVIALGLIMGFRPDGGITGVLSAIAIVVVFGVSLAWIWAAIGLVLRTAAAVSTLSFLVQFPLTMASNVFVEPKTMPSWLHAFVDVNPVSLLATTVRHLMAGTATGAEVTGILLASAAITAVFAPLTMRIYRAT
ncbi:MAG TPA: ABC transporter permease [Solirubrobacteraceae bacterium]|nr:ABC transporter permease [Solirubrobacteraceae bacterium]